MWKLRLFVVVGIVLLAATGCYTQFRSSPGEPYSGNRVDLDDRYGVPGYSPYDYWTLPYYTAFYGPYPDMWGWYAYPYYRDYWYPYPPYPPYPSLPAETGGRHAWDRGPGAPYLSPGGGGSGSPLPAPPSSPSVRPADPASPATPPADPPKDEKPRERKDEDRGNRRAWGR